MTISPIPPPINVASEPTGPSTARLARAVEALNRNHAFGDDSEIILATDDHTRRFVVQVVNRQSREIIAQLPAASIFQLANKLAR